MYNRCHYLFPGRGVADAEWSIAESKDLEMWTARLHLLNVKDDKVGRELDAAYVEKP